MRLLAICVAGNTSFFSSVDTRRLTEAIRWRRDALKSRSMREIVCTAALEVAIGARANMPYVEQSTIDSELGVFVTPPMNKRGSRAIYTRKNRIYGSMRQNLTQKPWLHTNAPLAALIVNAQVNYQSVYNARTNRRYYRAASPFKGKSPIAGRAAMSAAINRMIRSRHSSTHFLQSAWVDAIRALAPHSVNRGRARLAGPGGGNPGTWHNPHGSAIITENNASVSVFIENAIGLEGPNAQNFNAALWLHGSAGLQAAIDAEAASMTRHILEQLAKDDAKANAIMA